MPRNQNDVENSLWDAADQLRANSRLRSSEYSAPVLGLIFLRYADHKFTVEQRKLESSIQRSGRRPGISKADYHARGVLYVPESARYDRLLQLPEGENIGRAISEAMKAIETENEELRGVLPKDYNRLESDVLVTLLKLFSQIAMGVEGDAFGKIYEYFLSKFAMAEGQRGGEFFTPSALVKLIVEVIEPYHGRILDPACGSAGMFVQSANFVKRHKRNPNAEIALYGQEKVAETIRLSRMSLAVHGLSGDIKQGNTYYEDTHNSIGKFDFVMANPPFNVNGVDKEKIENDRRYALGIPSVDNANYLWIQIFWSALKEKGRAGFVMANSAADARGSELEIRKKLIQTSAVDAIIAIGPNMFYTVVLPCTLWFLDNGKVGTPRAEKVLFLDGRHVYRQVDRAHRDLTPGQIDFLANIVRLYRDEEPEFVSEGDKMLQEKFPNLKYHDVAGLCKAATLREIEAQNWSLNPGRYVGVGERPADDFDFVARLVELSEELEALNVEAHALESHIVENVARLLETS